MKTKLTLNIDDGVIKEMKILSKKRKQSISAMVENHLKNLTAAGQKKPEPKETFTQHFRKLFPMSEVEVYDYKEKRHKYLDNKYGGK